MVVIVHTYKCTSSWSNKMHPDKKLNDALIIFYSINTSLSVRVDSNCLNFEIIVPNHKCFWFSRKLLFAFHQYLVTSLSDMNLILDTITSWQQIRGRWSGHLGLLGNVPISAHTPLVHCLKLSIWMMEVSSVLLIQKT